MIRRLLSLALRAVLLVFSGAAAEAQLVITEPGPNAVVASAPDYATEVLNNPWDMDSAADLAGYVRSADFGSGLMNVTVANGLLSFTLGAQGTYFHLLSPSQPSTNPSGKEGGRYPIDTTRYRYLQLRMHLQQQGGEGMMYWFTGESYGNTFASTKFPLHSGWYTYTIDLATAPVAMRNNESRSWTEAHWVTGLRMDLFGNSGEVYVDWVRLTGAAPDTYSPSYSFASASGERFSLFLDNDTDPFNGYTQPLVIAGTGSETATVDVLPLMPGGYHVVGFVSRDFATLQGNPWDMSDAADVVRVVGVNNGRFEGGAYKGNAPITPSGVWLNTFESGVPAAQYNTVAVGLTASGAGQLYVYGSSTASATVPVSRGSSVYYLTLDRSGWTGQVGQLGLIFSGAVGDFSIDFVSLTRNQQAASLIPPDIVVSPGMLRVNAPPLLTILQPDAEGGEDFATAVLGNPWNMDDVRDLGQGSGISEAYIYPNNQVNGRQGDFFCAKNSDGDPYVASFEQLSTRGTRIDAGRYKNATIVASVDAVQDVVNGSMLRMIGWNRERDEKPFNGDDTVIQRNDRDWFTITQDLTALRLEPLLHPPGSYPIPIWSGWINMFRIDVHEFSTPMWYCVDSIHLRADDEANTRFALSYEVADGDSDPADTIVRFFLTTDGAPSGGQLIASARASDSTRVILWDTSAIPDGTYYVYAVVDDGYNSVTRPGPRLVIDHNRPQDERPPVLEVEAPLAGGVVYDTAQLRGYAIDNLQIALVEALVDGTLVDTFRPSLFHKGARAAHPNLADSSNAGFDQELNLTAFSEGAHTLLVRAFDTAGNMVSTERTVQRVGGAAPAEPAIPADDEPRITFPLNGGTNLSPPKIRTVLNVSTKKLRITIRQSSSCSALTLVGSNKKQNEALLSGIAIRQLTPQSGEITLEAAKLKGLAQNKKLGNSVLYLGLVCDGRVAATSKIDPFQIVSPKPVKKWQTYLKVLQKKLR